MHEKGKKEENGKVLRNETHRIQYERYADQGADIREEELEAVPDPAAEDM